MAFCQCGSFRFRESFPSEKFCPFCATPNPQKPEMPSYQAQDIPKLVLRRSTHLHCRRCNKTAESYSHKFCSACQNPFRQEPSSLWLLFQLGESFSKKKKTKIKRKQKIKKKKRNKKQKQKTKIKKKTKNKKKENKTKNKKEITQFLFLFFNV